MVKTRLAPAWVIRLATSLAVLFWSPPYTERCTQLKRVLLMKVKSPYIPTLVKSLANHSLDLDG